MALSPAMLIGCRLAQGAAAALLIPQGLGIIRDVFDDLTSDGGQSRAERPRLVIVETRCPRDGDRRLGNPPGSTNSARRLRLACSDHR
jgi:hypothetical protein